MGVSPQRRSSAALVLVCALLGGAGAVNAQPRPAVVELYTSEGCSSCPPAEAYLGELAERRDVLALAFHVDYWDDLGWRDPFGLNKAAQRQSLYAKTLHRSSPYTPQVIIDGRTDYVGSDRASIGRSLAANREGVGIALSVRDGQILIDLAAEANAAASDIVLVGYRRQAVSAIGRGENAGRTLTEFNIVRVFRTLGQWDGKAQRFQAGVDALPADATDVAVLVQPVGQRPIIGAATQPLR
ncbi:MAG TPA: DUF1223 domain-containing protein [Steroidobacteraceae bacterium]|nr:DUF1223 domain-containing protein [Steroidobacteraceae bacterium]